VAGRWRVEEEELASGPGWEVLPWSGPERRESDSGYYLIGTFFSRATTYFINRKSSYIKQYM
jgi:hypothetical protein